MMDIGLSVILLVGGVSVISDTDDCARNEHLLGSYISGTRVIELCQRNAESKHQDIGRIIRHEMVHLIQNNLGRTTSLIPDAVMTPMVRWLMDDREVMTVLLYEEEDIDQEFEARLLSNLPNWSLGAALWLSEHYRAIQAGTITPRYPWEAVPLQAVFWDCQFQPRRG